MIFEYIKEEICSDCGAYAYHDIFRGHHSNGEPFENRTFQCGKTIDHSPNFSRTRVTKNCSKTPESIASKKLWKEKFIKVMSYASKEFTKEQFESFYKNTEYWNWERK